MRSLLLIFVLACSVAVWAQNSSPNNSAPSNAQSPDSTSSKPATARTPNLAPPRSDTVNANDLGDQPGESSSKDTLIDLSPPVDDDKAHGQTSEVVKDGEHTSGNSDVGEFHFKRKNYRAAEDRYREALIYKANDAVATFRLAVCLEKMDQTDEARKEYESYLKILPHGPQAEAARKAIDRLKGSAASAKAGR